MLQGAKDIYVSQGNKVPGKNASIDELKEYVNTYFNKSNSKKDDYYQNLLINSLESAKKELSFLLFH